MIGGIDMGTKEAANMNDANERSVASAGSIAMLVLALIAGCAAHSPPQPTPDIRTCEGCGTRWDTPNPEPNPKPIKQCPNCPMTPEEFERLKEQLRKSNNTSEIEKIRI